MGCKSSTCIDSSKENNDRYPKFKIGDIVGISKRKNIFAKDYTPNWCEEVLVVKMIKKVENMVPWATKKLMMWMTKKLLERFTKKGLQKKIKKNLESKKN